MRGGLCIVTFVLYLVLWDCFAASSAAVGVPEAVSTASDLQSDRSAEPTVTEDPKKVATKEVTPAAATSAGDGASSTEKLSPGPDAGGGEQTQPVIGPAQTQEPITGSDKITEVSGAHPVQKKNDSLHTSEVGDQTQGIIEHPGVAASTKSVSDHPEEGPKLEQAPSTHNTEHDLKLAKGGNGGEKDDPSIRDANLPPVPDTRRAGTTQVGRHSAPAKEEEAQMGAGMHSSTIKTGSLDTPSERAPVDVKDPQKASMPTEVTSPVQLVNPPRPSGRGSVSDNTAEPMKGSLGGKSSFKTAYDSKNHPDSLSPVKTEKHATTSIDELLDAKTGADTMSSKGIMGTTEIVTDDKETPLASPDTNGKVYQTPLPSSVSNALPLHHSVDKTDGSLCSSSLFALAALATLAVAAAAPAH